MHQAGLKPDGLPRPATWQGLLIPEVTPARSLPGSSWESCPPNCRPSTLNLQIYFHNNAGDLESVLLKSKQNSRALQASLERGDVSGPAAHSVSFLFRSVFQDSLLLRSPQTPASGLCFPAVDTDWLLRAGALAGPRVFCPWTRRVKGSPGPQVSAGHRWWQLSPLLFNAFNRYLLRACLCWSLGSGQGSGLSLRGRRQTVHQTGKCVTAPATGAGQEPGPLRTSLLVRTAEGQAAHM